MSDGTGEPLTGEKTKARDILAAIPALKIIEQEHQQARPDERQALARLLASDPSPCRCSPTRFPFLEPASRRNLEIFCNDG